MVCVSCLTNLTATSTIESHSAGVPCFARADWFEHVQLFSFRNVHRSSTSRLAPDQPGNWHPPSKDHPHIPRPHNTCLTVTLFKNVPQLFLLSPSRHLTSDGASEQGLGQPDWPTKTQFRSHCVSHSRMLVKHHPPSL